MKTRRIPHRRGYALIMVAIFCVLFVTIMGVAWRHLASTIRTFHARSNQIYQDQGAIMALAEAMRALEVGPPPFTPPDSNTYTCYCVETVPVMQNLRLKYPTDKTKYPETPQTCNYQLTFTRPSAGVYTVTVTKVATCGSTMLDINKFGEKGPL